MPARNPLDHSGDGACGQHTTFSTAATLRRTPVPIATISFLAPTALAKTNSSRTTSTSFYIDKREAEPRGACLGSTGTEVRGGGEVPIAADHAAQVPAAVLRPMVRG